MALPKLASIPTFTCQLPSTSKEVTFRPFTVKEEKVLLMAAEAKDLRSIADAMVNVVKACVLQNDIRAEKLTSFDIEYLFIKIRSKSVGESITLGYKHRDGKRKDGQPCDKTTMVKINYDDITPPIVDPKKQIIMLSDTMGMKLRYLTLHEMVKTLGGANPDAATKEISVPQAFELMSLSLESVFEGDSVFYPDSLKEAAAFIESIGAEKIKEMVTFFDNIPKVEFTIPYTCECGQQEEVTLSGIRDFF